MRRICVLVGLATVLLGVHCTTQVNKITKFHHTGAATDFLVPDGVTSLDVSVWAGAGGGSHAEGRPWVGGRGGFVAATLAVTPGEVLSILVGGGGRRSSAGKLSAFPNGGKPGIRSSYIMGGGGGRSAIQRGNTELVVAGGGGGAGGTGGSSSFTAQQLNDNPLYGGDGGFPSGATGGSGPGWNCGGFGGTQTAGGNGACMPAGYTDGNGGKNRGGDGGDFDINPKTGNAAGGGGDGYYGGGAGDSHAGGGGGSSYADPSVTNTDFASGAAVTSKAHYESGIATSGSNADGGHGFIVVSYSIAVPDHNTKFHHTGAAQQFVVPRGVTSIGARLWGAAGAGSSAEGYPWAGGGGGFATGTVAVTPGETLTVIVGAGGRRSNAGKLSAYPNGGKPGMRSSYTTGGGGGRTAILRGNTELLVAGAGGGAGGTGGTGSISGPVILANPLHGGGGGHPSGSTGGTGPAWNCGGFGGTQTAGGNGACMPAGYTDGNGGKNRGGDGGDFDINPKTGNAAGGGGDGYYGGGAGDSHAGGGGGSSYAAPHVQAAAFSGGVTGGAAANTQDHFYESGVGSAATNADGGHGLAVITFDKESPASISKFSMTGAPQAFTVPAGVTSIEFSAWGAAGAGSSAEGYPWAGGGGGYVSGTIPVTPGETLTVIVGAGGRRSNAGKLSAYPNGGKPGMRSGYTTGGGGGRTAILRGNTEIAVAGAGGGAGGTGGTGSISGPVILASPLHGGGGGHPSGATGGTGPAWNCGGFGGTQTAGGNGACMPAGYTDGNGGKNRGGDGGDFNINPATGNSAGGGGDGYYGGGAGNSHAGGGGGSSFVSSQVHEPILANGVTGGVAGGRSDPLYEGNVGNGATNTDGQHGMVKLYYFDSSPQPPTPPPNVCTGACLFQDCPDGATKRVAILGAVSTLVWGTGKYTDDSHVGAAAVHAAALQIGETKTLDVFCTGAQTSYTGSEDNGVTTQSYTAWPNSFAFTLENATPAPPPPAPDQCFQEPCLHNKCGTQGAKQTIVVVGNANGGSVWGSSYFTDDSDVGAAAVHQGLAAVGESVAVDATCTGPQTSFPGSLAHGVTTNTWGPWHASFSLAAGPPIPTVPGGTNVCTGHCLQGCPSGLTARIRVRGGTFGYLWGTGTYADDTTVSAAAVHAGLVVAGEVEELVATCLGAQSSFTGSTANGVTTQSYGAWPGSFSLTSAPAPTRTVCIGLCLANQCNIEGRVFYLTVTGSADGNTWGSSIYSDDSSVAKAAVHAGLLDVGETKDITAVCKRPQSTFEGSTAHGVTTLPYSGSQFGTFTLEP